MFEGLKGEIRELLGKDSDEDGKKLEPDNYKISVSGWPEQANQTISEYVSSAAHKGANHVEITPNHPTSFTRHDIEEIKVFREQNEVEINIHAPMSLRTARAERTDYRRVEDHMEGYVELAKELGCDYINIHTSAHPSPQMRLPRRTRRNVMLTPDGEMTAQELIHEEAEKDDSAAFNWFVDYFMENYIRDLNHQDIGERVLMSDEFRESEYEDVNKYIQEEVSPEERIEIARDIVKDRILSRDELPVSEFDMYRLMAWKMYEKNDKIWRKICGDKDPIQLDEDGELDKLVDAVSGKYIEGHINNWKDMVEEAGIVVTFETPDCRDKDLLGYYRLVDLTRIYHVISSIGHPNFRVCVDLEHIATHGLDPMKQIKEAHPRLGEHVYLVHLSSRPSPGHEHKPIEKGEKDLYEMLWNLKKKGFENGYMVFERGGGEESEIWKESVPNVKEMAMFLEDDVSPDQLPAEFYGYTDSEFRRDEAIIRSHMFDPIEGLIETPNLRDTFLGSYAITEKRQSPEKWQGEEFR